eukprot:Gb_21774 [translate_table: standard]
MATGNARNPIPQHNSGNANMSALFVGILVPLLFSFVCRNMKRRKERGVPMKAGGDPGFTIRNSQFPTLLEVPFEGASTLAALFEQSCKQHRHMQLLGSRRLISRRIEFSEDGKPCEKLHLGDYAWLTYGEAFERACNFASGLIQLGHKRGERAAIFAETRAEWQIALQGCFRCNITVVSIYASLGEEALAHSLNEAPLGTTLIDERRRISSSGPKLGVGEVLAKSIQPMKGSRMPKMIIKEKSDLASQLFAEDGVVSFKDITLYRSFIAPWNMKRRKERGVPMKAGGDPGFTIRNSQFPTLLEVPFEGASTLAALFEQSCKQHRHMQLLGSRRLISRRIEFSEDGKPCEKLHLGDYAWLTYGEAFERACNFASGLIQLGHKRGERAAIFAETRAEWQIALQVSL